MGVRTHEVHASLVHAPLTLIPLAALIDLWEVVGRRQHGGRAGRRWGRLGAPDSLAPVEKGLERLGAGLWLAATLGGIAAGVSGLAASQEVEYPSRTAREMTVVHAVGNESVLLGALGLALWRRTRRPGRGSALTGLLVAAASFYTAYLGGEMVYQHQVGVEGMDRPEAHRRSPPLLSALAPVRLLVDAVKGARWLLGQVLSMRRDGVAPGAFGVGAEGLALQAEAAQAWRG